MKAALKPAERIKRILEKLDSAYPDARCSLDHKNPLQLLVATTVIEVGVDVPNASLMIIEHAERMGLSQLHQLRGRVGRGAQSSACILLYQAPLSELARERLKVIYENSDGFEVARLDLKLRGPGEILGARQSGVPMLRFADLERDLKLLEAARDAAEKMVSEVPGYDVLSGLSTTRHYEIAQGVGLAAGIAHARRSGGA